MKTLGWSGVSNASKIPLYLEYHGFENIVSRNATKHETPYDIKYYGITKNHGIA
jgi:hypothetical protein